MKNLHPARWLIAPALLLAFCSKGNSPSITGPSSVAVPAAVTAGGGLGISAAGDVKVGTGALEFLNLAIWGFNGDPGAGGYVDPGGSYAISSGVEVKLWATYVEGSPANPKFMVDWGDGSEPSAGGCGACRATHTYAIPGLYTVKASLDDRVSTMVTRTFTLDARPEPVVAAPVAWIDSHTGGGQTVYRLPSRPLPASPANLASWYQGICESVGLRPVSCDPASWDANYDASAWNAVILGVPYWGCNVSSGIERRTGWRNIITFHNPLLDDRGLCEQGCWISGNDVSPICTDAP